MVGKDREIVTNFQLVNAAREREQRTASGQEQQERHEERRAPLQQQEQPGERQESQVHQETLKLTREAVSILFQMEDPTSGEMLPPLRAEDAAVAELTAELMAAAQATYGDGVAPLTLTTAIAALEAGR